MTLQNYESRLEAFHGLTKGLNFKKPFPVEQFLKAPASTKYHGNYEGGLFDHSRTVFSILKTMSYDMQLKWSRPESPLIVGLFHDLCKIDQYEVNPEHSGHPFLYSKEALIPGHGDKSVMYLQKYLDLTEEEILCIRWHMGAFDEKENWEYYGKSVEIYSTVLFTHTADMMASRVYRV